MYSSERASLYAEDSRIVSDVFNFIASGSATDAKVELVNSTLHNNRSVPISGDFLSVDLTMRDAAISNLNVTSTNVTTQGVSLIRLCNVSFTPSHPLTILDGEVEIVTSGNARTKFLNSSIFLGRGSKLSIPDPVDGNTLSVSFEGKTIVNNLDSSLCTLETPKIHFSTSSQSLSTQCSLIVLEGISSVSQTSLLGSGDYSELKLSGEARYDVNLNFSGFQLLTIVASQNAENVTAIQSSQDGLLQISGLPRWVSVEWQNEPKFLPSFYPLFEVNDADENDAIDIYRSGANENYWIKSGIMSFNDTGEEERKKISLTRLRCPPEYSIHPKSTSKVYFCCLDDTCLVFGSIYEIQISLPDVKNVCIFGNFSVDALTYDTISTTVYVSECILKSPQDTLVLLPLEEYEEILNRSFLQKTVLSGLNENCEDCIDLKDVNATLEVPKQDCKVILVDTQMSSDRNLILNFEVDATGCVVAETPLSTQPSFEPSLEEPFEGPSLEPSPSQPLQPTSSGPTTKPSSPSSKSKTWIIIVAVIGGVILLALIILLIVLLAVKCK